MISGPMPSPGRRVTRYDRVPAGVPLVLRATPAALWGPEGAKGVLVMGSRARAGEEREREEEEGVGVGVGAGVGVAFARSAARGAPLRFRAGVEDEVLSVAPAGQSAAEAIARDLGALAMNET